MAIRKKIISKVAYPLIICTLLLSAILFLIFLQSKDELEAKNEQLASSLVANENISYQNLSKNSLYSYTSLFANGQKDRLLTISDNLNNISNFTSGLYNSNTPSESDLNYTLMPKTEYSSIKDELFKVSQLKSYFNSLNLEEIGSNNIYYCSESGFLLGNNIKYSNKTDDIDLRNWYLYKKAKDNGDIVWSKPYHDESNSDIITCAKAVYNSSGDFSGIIGIDFDIPSLLRGISESTGEDLFANYIIFDADCNIIFVSPSLSQNSSYINSETYSKIPSFCLSLDTQNANTPVSAIDNTLISLSNMDINDWKICFLVLSDNTNEQTINTKTTVSEFVGDVGENFSTKILFFFIVMTISIAILSCIFFLIMKKYHKSIQNSINTLKHQISQIGMSTSEKPTVKPEDTEMAELSDAINNISNSFSESLEQVAIEAAQNQQVLDEKKLSGAIKSIVNPKNISCSNIDIYSLSKAAQNPGNDFYNYFFATPEILVFIIGETKCSGISSALLASYISGTMELASKSAKSSAEVMNQINQRLFEKYNGEISVKALIGFLNTSTLTLDYCNSSTYSPIIKSKNNTKILPFLSKVPLGSKPDTKYKSLSHKIKQGEALILVTDGIDHIKSTSKENDNYSELVKITKSISLNSSKEICSSILCDISLLNKGMKLTDDITIMSIRIRNTHFHKKILNNLDDLKICLKELNSFIESNSVPRSYYIMLTVEEILTNIIKHGSKKELSIDVYLEVFKNYSKVVIIDNSFAFDLNKIDSPDIYIAPNKRKPGGLGLHLIKNITQSCSYYRKNDQNINIFII